MAEDKKDQNNTIPGPPLSAVSPTGSNRKVLKPLDTGYVQQTKEKFEALQKGGTSEQKEKIKKELSTLNGVVTPEIEKIEKNLATTIVENSISGGITQASQKVVDAKQSAINNVATSFVKDVTNAAIQKILNQNSSVSTTENTVSQNTGNGENQNDLNNRNSFSEKPNQLEMDNVLKPNFTKETIMPNSTDDDSIDSEDIKFELESIPEETQEEIDNEEKSEIDNTPLNKEQKPTLSDLFKRIGDQLNRIDEGIGKGFTALSKSIGNKETTFSNIITESATIVDDTKNDVGKSTNITDNIKSKISGALDTLKDGLKNSIPKMTLSKRANPSNRDKVFGKMLGDFSKAVEDIFPSDLKESLRDLRRSDAELQEVIKDLKNNRPTQSKQQGQQTQLNVNPTNSANLETPAVNQSKTTKVDQSQLEAATIPSLEKLAANQRKKEEDESKSRENIAGDFMSGVFNEVGNNRKQSLDNTEQNLQSNSTTQTQTNQQKDNTTLRKSFLSSTEPDMHTMYPHPTHENDPVKQQQQQGQFQQQLQPQQPQQQQQFQQQYSQQPQSLGLLNTNSVDSLNLGQFHNNRPQQYVPRNPELDDIYRKLDRIEDRLANSQQQPAPQPEKSEMSNGMKAGIAVCFLLLFMINPGLAMAIGAAAAVGVGSFYAGKAIMGKIDEYRDNRKNKENNNQALEQQQGLNQAPSQNQTQTVTPPSTPTVNNGQNRVNSL